MRPGSATRRSGAYRDGTFTRKSDAAGYSPPVFGDVSVRTYHASIVLDADRQTYGPSGMRTGVKVDMGAYEFQGKPARVLFGDIDGDGRVGIRDLATLIQSLGPMIQRAAWPTSTSTARSGCQT